MVDKLLVNIEWCRFGLCSRFFLMILVVIIRCFMCLVIIINVVGRIVRMVNYLKCGV